jgi:hypothetical protein
MGEKQSPIILPVPKIGNKDMDAGMDLKGLDPISVDTGTEFGTEGG